MALVTQTLETYATGRNSVEIVSLNPTLGAAIFNREISEIKNLRTR